MSEQTRTDPVEVAAVREGENLDWDRLEHYLRANLNLEGTFSVQQFPHGSANLTYRVAFGDEQLVVRRPPFGEIAAGGHDMGREYKALSQLWQGFDRAPRALHHCTDVDVVGAEFIVVEYRPGIIVWGALPTSMEHLPDAGRRIGFATVEALADLHNVDHEAVGLGGLGRPEGFIDRQLAGWLSRWDRVRPDVSDDAVAELGRRLRATQPVSQRPVVLHNDFKIDNCQFQPGAPDRVTSVFDWDMATIGDPLADLGTLLNYWPGDPGEEGSQAMAVPGLDSLGLPGKAQIVTRYSELTGLDVTSVAWYEALGCWRTSVILQQLFDRWQRGESTDARMADRGALVFPLARRGLAVLEGM